jgi:lipoprotein-releasing system permease protein
LNSEISPNQKPPIFIGQELARNIGARIGDNVWAITPGSIGISAFSIPKAHLFRVEGYLQTGLYEYDAAMALIGMKQAQALFGMKADVSEIGVRLKNIDDAEAMAKQLQLELNGRYWVRSWLALNKNLFSALKLEKAVMFIILTLVTLVSSFMIVSNLLLIITQKVREIGILRAMGADAGLIHRTFLLKGFLMGAIGTLVGLILGVGISILLAKTNLIKLPADVYYIDKLPIRLDPMDILMVVTAAVGIVLVATLFPARKAAKLDPIEAIRYG